MASAPYRIIDKRASAGYSSTNKLIEAATQTSDRQTAPVLDYDVHRTISNYGRRILLNIGRMLFWKFPSLQASIIEQANLAVSSFIPQFTGKNIEWGAQAKGLLNGWHKIMDIAGWPYDYDSYLQFLVISPLVEGEIYTLLTETPDGYPLIQTVGSHRVGSRLSAAVTVKVRFYQDKLWIDGVLIDDSRPYLAEDPIEFDAKLIDGVIVDDFSRPIAYRVYEDNFVSSSFQDLPARNFFPAFIPMVSGQVRGFSGLASSAFNWEDIDEWKKFEMLAHKVFSSKTVMEYNETGEADTAKQLIQTAATFDATTNLKTALDVQKLDGGTYHYLKAKSGSKLEAFDYNRPGADSQNFMNSALRDAFRGTEWDVFFSLDPQKVGGAPMRVIVEKINAVLDKRRKLVKKCCLRVDGYALSKFMKMGLLPWNDEWFMWDYQGPGEVTADKKYDSDVALQEMGQGISTRKLECARRGLHLEDVDAQRLAEARSDLMRAQELATEFKITIQEALVVLRPPTPNQQLPSNSQSKDQSPKSKAEETAD
jgi:hypothetical protein